LAKPKPKVDEKAKDDKKDEEDKDLIIIDDDGPSTVLPTNSEILSSISTNKENAEGANVKIETSADIKPSRADGLEEVSVRMFHDENLTTFFRRCSFSPDGRLLFAPAGILIEGIAFISLPLSLLSSV
jgi:hypothetical protein